MLPQSCGSQSAEGDIPVSSFAFAFLGAIGPEVIRGIAYAAFHNVAVTVLRVLSSSMPFAGSEYPFALALAL